MTAIVPALRAALLDFVWQGLLAAFLLWTALFILRNRSARVRYAASCVALAGMAILPVLTAFLVYTAPAASLASPAWAATTPPAHAAMPGIAAASFNWASWLTLWALPLWTLGVLFFSLRLVWASRQISALRRQAQPAEAALLAIVANLQERMMLARPLRVLVSAVADCPSVVGWFRPVLLLPTATVLGLTPQQLEAVLAHELAHILRYDYLVNMLQAVVETLLFYHPAVWWASARIRQERELCCDDLAVESCGDALCYARALTRLERLRVTTPRLALGSAGGPLLYRIQRLAGDEGWQRGPSKLAGILALSLGLLCFTLNMPWARGQQPDARVPEPAPAVEASVPDEPGVRVDLGGASVIHRDDVEYPEAAVERGIQGTVVVEATLDADGVVNDARVLSGPLELRKAALESVLQWRFTHGAAGSTRQISIAFELSAGGSHGPAAGALARSKRELDRLQARMQKQLAEELANEARIIQDRPSADGSEVQTEAEQLAEMLAKAQADHKLESENLAQLYAEQALRPLAQVLRDREMGVLQSKLAEIQADSDRFTGRRLKTITIEGLTLTSQRCEELLAMLPVHEGDTLSADSQEKVEEAVQRFDRHASLSMLVTRDGQVEIRITVQ
jgi:TonB family protein